MFCSQCGAPHQPSALFCEDCGARSRHGDEAGPPRAQGLLSISGQKRDADAGRVCIGLPRRPLSAPALAFTMMGGFAAG